VKQSSPPPGAQAPGFFVGAGKNWLPAADQTTSRILSIATVVILLRTGMIRKRKSLVTPADDSEGDVTRLSDVHHSSISN
jgi:hypothetical protein